MPSRKRPQPELEVKITPENGAVIVTLVGEARFDFDVADGHAEKIMAHQPKALIIDMAGLTFASSVGINFLIHLRRAMQTAGGTIKLAGVQPNVEAAMKGAQVLKLFAVFPDLAAALAAR